MLAHGVGDVRHRIGSGPRETAAPIPSRRILSDSGIDLGEARYRAGHHDAALPEESALAIDIGHCISSCQRRESIRAGVSGVGTFRRKRHGDGRSRSCEAGIHVLRRRETALAR